MADHAAVQLRQPGAWTAFLQTAARLYKYPYLDQLMIYAQRPDATACAAYDLWNDRMGRYVKRGAKGIALLDDSRGRPVLRYVFDVSDTGTQRESRAPWLWTLEEPHLPAVTATLEQSFEIPGDGGLVEQLEIIAATLSAQYWSDYREDVLDIVDGSLLAAYDDDTIGVQFRSAATISVAYTLLSRCGLAPEEVLHHEDFMPIFDFNTPATIGALGTAVSQLSEQVLRQIERTVKHYEREQIAERSDHHELEGGFCGKGKIKSVSEAQTTRPPAITTAGASTNCPKTADKPKSMTEICKTATLPPALPLFPDLRHLTIENPHGCSSNSRSSCLYQPISNSAAAMP